MKKIFLFSVLITLVQLLSAQNYQITLCSDTSFNGLYQFYDGEDVQYISSTKVMFPKGSKTEGWIIAREKSREPELPFMVNSDTNSLKYPPVKGWILVSEKGQYQEQDMIVKRINKQPFPVWIFPLMLFMAFVFVVRSGKKKTKRGEES